MITQLSYVVWKNNTSITHLHPSLKRLFIFVAASIRLLLPKASVLVTSTIRTNGGTHSPGPDGYCYCIDFQVVYKETTMFHSDIRQALLKTKSLVELIYPYGIGGDRKAHHAFVWETFDGNHNDHVHLQINRHTHMLGE